MEELVLTQTSAPDWLVSYLRQLSVLHYHRKLNRMYVHMMQSFISMAPWEATPPLPWKSAKVHRVVKNVANDSQYAGWIALNMQLPISIVNQIKQIIEGWNQNQHYVGRPLSIRTFLYTAIYWWCTYVYPYKGMRIVSE